MQVIDAVYDGAAFKTKQPIPVNGQHKVVIAFLEPLEENNTALRPSKKRPISELRGFLKSRVCLSDDFDEPLEEMREYME